MGALVNASICAGSSSGAAPLADSGSEITTVGMACSSVHWCKLRACTMRVFTPITTIEPNTTAAIAAARRKRRGEIFTSGSWVCSDMSGHSGMVSRIRVRRVLVTRMHDGENDGNEDQRGRGGEQQATDHGATQRRVLLAAITK